MTRSTPKRRQLNRNFLLTNGDQQKHQLEQVKSILAKHRRKLGQRLDELVPSSPFQVPSLHKDEKNNDDSQEEDEHKEPSPEILHSSTKSLILKAMKFWESQTCLRFEENANVKSKLKFFKGDGCWSYVGKIYAWDSQQVSIGEGCEHFGVITHEIAHALGFFHAQSRYDRDSYVSFKAQNVESGFEDQFDKEMPDSNDNYGVTYDYGSVMHYSDSAFAKYEKRPVLVASEPHNQNTMGQRMQPSFSDVLVMNRHYNCLDQCKNSETKCANGGYPSPKDCSKCTCPWGFGGTLCNERQDASNGSTTCGQTLQATSEWQQLDGSVGDSTKVLKTEFTSCHWHIGTSEGKKIELQVIYVGRVCSSGCFYGNVEFKTTADFGRTGHRMCCAADAKDKPLLKTDTNLAVISAYTRFFDQQFVVKYRSGSKCAIGSDADFSFSNSKSLDENLLLNEVRSEGIVISTVGRSAFRVFSSDSAIRGSIASFTSRYMSPIPEVGDCVEIISRNVGSTAYPRYEVVSVKSKTPSPYTTRIIGGKLEVRATVTIVNQTTLFSAIFGQIDNSESYLRTSSDDEGKKIEVWCINVERRRPCYWAISLNSEPKWASPTDESDKLRQSSTKQPYQFFGSKYHNPEVNQQWNTGVAQIAHVSTAQSLSVPDKNCASNHEKYSPENVEHHTYFDDQRKLQCNKDTSDEHSSSQNGKCQIQNKNTAPDLNKTGVVISQASTGFYVYFAKSPNKEAFLPVEWMTEQISQGDWIRFSVKSVARNIMVTNYVKIEPEVPTTVMKRVVQLKLNAFVPPDFEEMSDRMVYSDVVPVIADYHGIVQSHMINKDIKIIAVRTDKSVKLMWQILEIFDVE
ncbi:astacin (Peptidase family m12A) domain-containing protein [Ditylenchus destructor]|nr:astacin (Peptidase family m12A) domain-containing protein [Ditylenchus destructor]